MCGDFALLSRWLIVGIYTNKSQLMIAHEAYTCAGAAKITATLRMLFCCVIFALVFKG
jgi:hypothetical protein